MDRADWDARYAASELVWGSEANRFVAEELGAAAEAFGRATSRPGEGGVPARALDLACGEGRNAIFLAGRGWSVTAVDFSSVAIARARERAAAAAIRVDFRVDDVVTFRAEPRSFGLVLIAYLQLPMAAFSSVLASAAEALRPGGTLFMIGHAVRNLAEGSGGPRDVRVLWDPDGTAAMLGELGLDVVRCEEVLRPTGAPGARPAIDLLVRALRRG